jgi:glycine reductase
MHPENPGIDSYRQYKDKKMFAFSTSEVVSGMEEALDKVTQCVSKISTGAPLGSAAVEGYIPRGFRIDESANKRGATRAVEMLLDKLAGRPFTSEIPIEHVEGASIAPPITDLRNICLSFITTSGVVLKGNPDGFRGYQNTQWCKYSIEKLESMQDIKWDVIHGGINTQFIETNPNYGIPLDVSRDIEKEGLVGKIFPYFYITPGARAIGSVMHRIGTEIANDLKKEGVHAVILTST